MSRRVSLPGADELFRRTGQSGAPEEAPMRGRPPLAAAPEPAEAPVPRAEPGGTASTPADARRAGHPASATESAGESARSRRRASGRVRHDEKMTVYVTADELLDIEHARLALRRQVGAVDRGRLVRAAVAMALADLDEHGADSELVRRLSTS